MEIYREETEVSLADRSPSIPTRSGRKPLGRVHQNHPQPSQTPGHKKLASSQTMEKENNTMATTTHTPNSTTQSFRRALRGKGEAPKAPGITVQPTTQSSVSFAVPKAGGLLAKQASKKTSLGPAARVTGSIALGPPQRCVPKTPNSLLRTELDFFSQRRFYDEMEGDDCEYDDEDDVYGLDESSLLVSPPGALWNVLGAQHNPGSASSTSLLVMPPSTAETIQRLTSTKKKKNKKQSDPWTSPPLQPRSLLQTTPECPLEEEVEENLEASTALATPVDEDPSRGKRKGVAMDLSTMFSDEKIKHNKKDSSTSKQQAQLVERLKRPTVRSKAREDITEMPESDPMKSLSKTGRKECLMSSLAVEPQAKGTGVTMDMSEMFFSLASPPPKVLQRFSKPAKKETLGELPSKEQNSSVATAQKKNVLTQSKIPSSDQLKPQLQERRQDEATPVQDTVGVEERNLKDKTTCSNIPEAVIESKSRGKGLSMDMSNLFVQDTSSLNKQPKPTPPPALLKRLEQRTLPRSNATKVTDKKEVEWQSLRSKKAPSPAKNTKKDTATTRAKSTKEKKNQTTSSSVCQASVQKKGGPSKLETKRRLPLQKNDNFFGSSALRKASDVNRVVAEASTTVSKNKGSAFEISAPTEGVCKAPLKRTPVKSLPTKHSASPHKIARDADDWAGKQCDTFASWLNYTFNPDEDEDHGTTTSGLRALVIHRRLAQVRFRAAELFQSPSVTRVRNIVQAEIARGRLTIRTDRDLYADLSLRKQAVQLLLSYTTPWLRLGLEVMFGECIMPEHFQDGEGGSSMTPVARMRSTLRSFVVDRVLSDTDVWKKYTKGRTKVPSGKFETMYREEMRTLVLYRLMVLILFLDQLKMNNILDKVPRLFTKSSEVKSSKAVLLVFCRDFLSAEGDFIKHLSRIGLKVSYEQDPIDELEFKVTNFATDLRDGSRLTRLTEIVTDTPFKTVMRSLRLPAVSRLQKMHNVKVAMDKLKEYGIFVPKDLNAHHIVDAHREMVLKLMWSIIAHSCMTKLLTEGQVEQEIENVLHWGQARRKMEGLKARSPRRLTPDKAMVNGKGSPEEVLKSLLFRWCNAVCSNFGLKVENFQESFADGKALCFLVHYYHPAVVRMDDILPTSLNEDESLTDDQILVNERKNSSLVAKRVTELGGIPNMLPITDSQHPPDDKSILLCLTYLCSRLMESSEEIFATIVIQACYRRYREKILLEKKQEAASVIFRVWTENKDQYYAAQQRRYAAAVAIIEDFVCANKGGLLRMMEARLVRELQVISAITIQCCYRCMKGRERFADLSLRKDAAVTIQTYFRRFNAQLDYLELLIEKEAAIQIQKLWRAHSLFCRYQLMRRSAISIQASARGTFARQCIEKQHIAASVIQRAWKKWVEFADAQIAAIVIQALTRGYQARANFQELQLRHGSSCMIQKVWRGYRQATVFLITREFMISIQKHIRGYLVRKNLPIQELSRAAIVVQKAWRGFSAQVQYNLDVMDIVCVQSLARKQIAKREASCRLQAICSLQRAMRCRLAREQLERHRSILVLQCAFRARKARVALSSLVAANRAAVCIQSAWRSFPHRQAYLIQLAAVIKIQSFHRSSITVKKWQATKSSVQLIQGAWRTYCYHRLRQRCAILIQSQVRKQQFQTRYRQMCSATLRIQSAWRRFCANFKYSKVLVSVVQLQANWRRYFAKLNYELDLLEIVICQGIVRRFLSQREMIRRQNAIQTLQNSIRCCIARSTLHHLRSQHADFIQWQSAATIIQAAWRGFACYMDYKLDSCNVVIVQSIIRRYLARSDLLKKQFAVMVLQCAFRRSLSQREMIRRQNAIQTLQNSIRCCLSRSTLYHLRSQQAEYMRRQSASTIIQAAWRGFACYMDYKLDSCNVVIVQSIIRRYLARSDLLKKQFAVMVIQCAARRRIATMQVQALRHEEYLLRTRIRAAGYIQAAFRGSRVREDLWWNNAAATVIQAKYRTHVAQILYELDRYDIIVLQSLARRWLAVRATSRKTRSIVKVQTFARAWFARRMTSKLWLQKQAALLKEKAATKLQTSYRGYLARRNLAVLNSMAIAIQTSFRRHYCSVWFQMYLVDVIIAQSQVRRWLVQRYKERAGGAAQTIQAKARQLIAVKRVSVLRSKKLLWENQNFACQNIQRVWRGHRSRKFSAKHAAARKIQKTWRGFIAHFDYLVQQLAIIHLQARVRAYQARLSHLKFRSGIVRLQAAARGYILREHIRFVSLSATVVQANFRRNSARLSFIQMKQAAIRIQAVARGNAVREEVVLCRFAASEIQRIWRGFAQFCDYFVHIESAVKIQCFFRKQVAIKRSKQVRLARFVDYCFFTKKACTIQRSYRLHLHQRYLDESAKVIQCLVRSYIQRRRATALTRGVKRLQAVFRAKHVRRRRNKKIAEIVSRLEVANRKARRDPNLRIGYRTRHALWVIQNSKSLADIMDAVKSLETSTRLSELCCALFTEADAARILLDLIRSCNRSVPHVELVQCILLTLDNVSQYRKLVPSFADCNSAEIFLDKMQMFRDKDGIFVLSISLLQSISICNPAVEEFCAMHEHLKRLKALHELSLRRNRPVNNMPSRRIKNRSYNRVKRREHFDRNAAIKTLGILTEKFEVNSLLTPTSNAGRKHFVF